MDKLNKFPWSSHHCPFAQTEIIASGFSPTTNTNQDKKMTNLNNSTIFFLNCNCTISKPSYPHSSTIASPKIDAKYLPTLTSLSDNHRLKQALGNFCAALTLAAKGSINMVI